jgi:hypothetical protein
MKLDDPTLERLLAGDKGLTASETDAALDAILARQTSAKTKAWRFMLPVALAAGLASLVIYVQDDEFAARGNKQSNLRVACHLKDGNPLDDRCAPGETLRFEVEGAAPYFAAFAKLPDGTISWIVPANESDLSLPIGHTRQWLPLAAEVDAQVGKHTVFGVFSKEPLTRAKVRVLVEKPDIRLAEILERKIQVQ